MENKKYPAHYSKMMEVVTISAVGAPFRCAGTNFQVDITVLFTASVKSLWGESKISTFVGRPCTLTWMRNRTLPLICFRFMLCG